jgi:hypothetical protein
MSVLFFFRKPKVIVDCFTDVPQVFEFAKPDNAIKFIPDWWKNTPVSYVPEGSFFKHATLKGCDGVINNFKHGLVIPMWCDVAIQVGPRGTNYYRYQFADNTSSLDSHNPKQFGGHIKEEEIQHIKFHSPWFFSCKENIHWVWVDPKWNTIRINDYIILPGITSFKYQASTNINALFYRGEKLKTIEIKYGTPLIHMIPLTDRKLTLKHHLVDQNEFSKLNLNTTPVKFINSIQILKKLRTNKK